MQEMDCIPVTVDNAILAPKLDVVFKRLFADDESLLADLLSGLLNIERASICKVNIASNEMMPDNAGGKISRLDLNVELDNELVNIEIQLRNSRSFTERSIFYWAKLYTSTLKSGDDYTLLKRTITLNIVNFTMFPDRTDFHTEIVPTIRGTTELFSDKLSLHFFELKKVSLNDIAPDNRSKLWLQFLNVTKDEELNMLEETGVPEICTAAEKLRKISVDYSLRCAAITREKEIRDEIALRNEGIDIGIDIGRNQGIDIGRNQGINLGREQERSLRINKMKALGYSERDIELLFE